MKVKKKKGSRSQVQGSTFRVKDKEGIEDLNSSIHLPNAVRKQK